VSVLAFLIYLAMSIGYFGLPVLAHPSRLIIGYGTDPASHMWFLAWWPHAIRHGLNPFVTHVLWAPSGYNLAGSTSIPGPSLLMAPITETLGPVVSYNILALLAPALSAWTAYLLCRHVGARYWPSVMGGYLFGFSTYEIAQLMGHPNLILVLLIPLLILLVLRRVEGSLGTWPFVGLMTLALAFQFLISTEVFLTATIFGLLAFVFAMVFWGPAIRARLFRTGLETAGAYVLAAIPLSPFLYYGARSLAHPPIYPFYPWVYSADLANFITPTPVVKIGGAAFANVAANFTGNVTEQVAYVGLPLLLAIALFAVTRWRTRSARFLIALFALIALASLGPVLHVMGKERFVLPWRAIVGLPLVRYALPARFMLYGFLLSGLMMALWLSAAPTRGPRAWGKWALVLLSLVFLVPNTRTQLWKTKVDTPSFFSQGLYRQYFRPGESTVVLPFGGNGQSMLWQAQTGFAFPMAEGYVSVAPPPEFADDPALDLLYTGRLTADAQGELRAFLRAHQVRFVVAAPGTPAGLYPLLRTIDGSPVLVGGVELFRVPGST
jgi:hypothetical protein